jgi:cytochrome c-type biogenesis protein CcmH
MASRFAAFVAALMLCLVAHAQTAKPAAEDPVLEKRVMRLAEELRCLVCQNQTIADSHADLAIDLRNQVREQLKAGKSEADVIAYMTARYGDFVLYRPPVKGATMLLWFGPAVLVVAGVAGMAIYIRQRRRLAADAPDEGLHDGLDDGMDDYGAAKPAGSGERA